MATFSTSVSFRTISAFFKLPPKTTTNSPPPKTTVLPPGKPPSPPKPPPHRPPPPSRCCYKIIRLFNFAPEFNFFVYSEVQIRNVWTRNFGIEMARFESMLEKYNMIAFDTKFPGFLCNTPRYASEEARYADLKFNVDRLKLIQLGLTLFDNKARVWQFNFSDFDITKDLQVQASIRLLISNGINFKRNRFEGVHTSDFQTQLKKILAKHREVKWVTFHGLYDVGYFLRVLTQTNTPGSVEEFAKKAGEVLGRVYDVKFMAKFCTGLMDGLLGLEKLSKILMVERVGEAHQAGSDSLLTARVFSKMVKVYGLVKEAYEGLLFGISAKIEKVRVLVVFDSPQYYYPFPSQYEVPMGHGASQVHPWCHHQPARVFSRPPLLQGLPAVV